MRKINVPDSYPLGAVILCMSTLLLLLSSCKMLEITGDTIVVAGKTATAAVKITEAVAGTAVKVGKVGVRLAVGKRAIKLEREGNSFYVTARVNRHYKTRLLVDTGATHVQISSTLARRMGLGNVGDLVPCTLADGSVVYARSVSLRDVRLGRARAKDVRALVFESEEDASSEGLLGMSFLEQFRFEIDTDRELLILAPK